MPAAVIVIAFLIVAIIHFAKAPNWKEALRRRGK